MEQTIGSEKQHEASYLVRLCSIADKARRLCSGVAAISSYTKLMVGTIAERREIAFKRNYFPEKYNRPMVGLMKAADEDLCSVCDDEVEFENALLCGHRFHTRCIEKSIDNQIGLKLVEIVCPHSKCDYVIPQYQVKELTSSRAF